MIQLPSAAPDTKKLFHEVNAPGNRSFNRNLRESSMKSMYWIAQMQGRENYRSLIRNSQEANWMRQSTAFLEPLAGAIAKRVKDGAAFLADDTPLKMLAPGNKKTKTAHIWAYVWNEPT